MLDKVEWFMGYLVLPLVLLNLYLYGRIVYYKIRKGK